MDSLSFHWTEEDVESFLYRIAWDFVQHVETVLESRGMNRAEFASALGVSQGRVSQVLNNPGNLTMKQIVKYARVLGEKVTIVAYSDGDQKNVNGPIPADIFARCWESAGRPADYFDIDVVEVSDEVFSDRQSVTTESMDLTLRFKIHGKVNELNQYAVNKAYSRRD